MKPEETLLCVKTHYQMDVKKKSFQPSDDYDNDDHDDGDDDDHDDRIFLRQYAHKRMISQASENSNCFRPCAVPFNLFSACFSTLNRFGSV